MSTGVVSPLMPKQGYIVIAVAGAPPLASPGVATITTAGRKMKLDRQEGYGTDGGRLVMTGTAIQDVDVAIRIWETSHWVEWKAFFALLTLPITLAAIPNAVVPALSIDHPILSELGIRSVVLEDPGFWLPGETGDWTRTLSFVVKQRPQPRLAAPKEQPPAVSAAAVRPLNDQQQENARQDARNEKLRIKLGLSDE